MQYVGDAVMAVFGAPVPAARPRPPRGARRRRRCTPAGASWTPSGGRGLAPFGLGIGLSTGEVAAALLGSEERLEYTLVGDTVNLAQRLQDLARPAGSTVVGLSTVRPRGAGRRRGLGPQRFGRAAGRGPADSRRVHLPQRTGLAGAVERDHPMSVSRTSADAMPTAANLALELGDAAGRRPAGVVRQTFEAELAPGARPARRRPGGRRRRLRRGDGAVGLRQVHAAEPGRRAGRAGRGRDRGGRRADRRQGRGLAGAVCAAATSASCSSSSTCWTGMTALENVALPGDDRRAEAASRRVPGPRPARPARPRRQGAAGARRCCPAASASGSRSPGRWPTSPPCCSPTSRPARWTARAAWRCSSCSAGCTPTARRS